MKLKLSTAQKMIYKEKLSYFHNGIFSKKDENALLNYYLYEIANGEYDSQDNVPAIIYHMFQVRDQIHEVYENNAYMILLCESFMIAHPDYVDLVVSMLRTKGIRIYEDEGCHFKSGDYSAVSSYIRSHASKSILPKLKDSEKSHVLYSFEALEEVCYHLEDAFRDTKEYVEDRESHSYVGQTIYGVEGFRSLMSAGKQTNTFLSVIELKSFGDRPAKKVRITDSVFIELTSYKKNQPVFMRYEWELLSTAKDLYGLIYLYTESIMRERLGAPKRARSVKKILDKRYQRGNVELTWSAKLLKRYISNPRFEKGIAAGVDAYLSMHPEIVTLASKTDKFDKNSKSSSKTKDLKTTGKSNENSKTSSKTKNLKNKKENVSSENTGNIKSDVKEQMKLLDAGQLSEIHAVSKEKLSTVKSEADAVLNLLHVDEIDYEGTEALWDSPAGSDLYSINHCESDRQHPDESIINIDKSNNKSSNEKANNIDKSNNKSSNEEVNNIDNSTNESSNEVIISSAGSSNELSETGMKQLDQDKTIDLQTQDHNPYGFTTDEQDWLQFIYNKDYESAHKLVKSLKTTEKLLMKSINEKALEVLDDICLEYENGYPVIIEDYLDVIKK